MLTTTAPPAAKSKITRSNSRTAQVKHGEVMRGAAMPYPSKCSPHRFSLPQRHNMRRTEENRRGDPERPQLLRQLGQRFRLRATQNTKQSRQFEQLHRGKRHLVWVIDYPLMRQGHASPERVKNTVDCNATVEVRHEPVKLPP